MKSGWPRRLLLIVAGTVAALFVAAAVLTLTGEDQPQDPAGPPQEEMNRASAPSTEVTLPSGPAPLYRVASYQGLVSVFPPQGDRPIQVTETPVAALPEADQAALERGIEIFSQEELAGLLEDYGS